MATQKGRRARVDPPPGGEVVRGRAPDPSPTSRARPAVSAAGTIRARRAAITSSQRRVQQEDDPRAHLAGGSTMRPPSALPEGEAGHEHGQDDRHHGRGHAEAGHGQAQPHHLAEQRAETGDDEEREEPAVAQRLPPRGPVRPRRAGYTKVPRSFVKAGPIGNNRARMSRRDLPRPARLPRRAAPGGRPRRRRGAGRRAPGGGGDPPRVIAAGGPALLFTNVDGRRLPAGDQPLRHAAARAELAFGTPAAASWSGGSSELAQTLLPPTPGKLWGARDVRPRAAARRARGGARSGPVDEVVDARRAPRPPARAHQLARGRRARSSRCRSSTPSIPSGHGHNLGIYRMQVHDPRTTGMHWQIGKGGGFHYAVAEARGRGAAGDRVPRRAARADARRDRAAARERARADARLADRRRAAARSCRGPGPHPLVADAEFALVGRVPPRERATRRARSATTTATTRCATTTRSSRSSAIARRRDAIYPATVVGKPRQEDFFIGDLLQELLSPLFPLVMPAVRAPLVVRRDRLPLARRRGREAALPARGAWPAPSASSARGSSRSPSSCSLTDRPVDLRDFRATLEHVLARTHPETDLYVFSNLSMDTLDYTGPRVNEGSKGVWLGLGDPVRELPREFSRRRDLPAGVTDGRASSAAAAWWSAARPTRAEPGGRRAPRRASRLRGLAAARADRRAARAPRAAR